jgi:hypothetical protein
VSSSALGDRTPCRDIPHHIRDGGLGTRATVGRVNVLVSWNFKQIVNLERIHGYNSVNLRKGYPMIEIRTPREVLSDE